ncbi:MAG: hypothetical protein EOP53_10600 [Sphingobacteriales bacterium]|nr:MAG: hypothetical protein EOP53_10600 [Sphingobacteriales bacterium]
MAKYLRNSVPMEHIYMPVSVILSGWFYYQNIEDERSKMIIKWVTPLMVIFSISNTLFIQDINTYPDNIMKVATLFNLIWGAVLLIQFLDIPASENVFKNPYFLVALGIVWFNIISSLYFFLTAFLTRNKISPHLVSWLHYGSNYIYYIILFVAMIFLRRKNNNHVREARI